MTSIPGRNEPALFEEQTDDREPSFEEWLAIEEPVETTAVPTVPAPAETTAAVEEEVVTEPEAEKVEALDAEPPRRDVYAELRAVAPAPTPVAEETVEDEPAAPVAPVAPPTPVASPAPPPPPPAPVAPPAPPAPIAPVAPPPPAPVAEPTQASKPGPSVAESAALASIHRSSEIISSRRSTSLFRPVVGAVIVALIALVAVLMLGLVDIPGLKAAGSL